MRAGVVLQCVGGRCVAGLAGILPASERVRPVHFSQDVWRPFLTTTLVVAVMVFGISAYLAPKGLRELRNWATKVKADFVITIVQPGRFMTAERGLTIHIRERRADGQLLGVFVDDRRDAAQRATFLAEYGEIGETGRGTFLVLMNGNVQRVE